jgi:hypothetical protein
MIVATRTAAERAASRSPGQSVVFVILSAPRSGSWLLWTSLAQHARVALYGELFNDEVYECEPSARVLCSPPMIARPLHGRGDRSHEYLEDLLVQFAASSFGAVGFKLLYGQGRRNTNGAGLWPYLEQRTDIRVLHVVRDNLFGAFLSLKTALATDQWASGRGGETHMPAMYVPVGECREYFESQLRKRRTLERRFRHHDLLEVEYERDLVGNYAATMERIQAFLDLPRQRVSPTTRRQARGPVSRRVINYRELRETFTDTPFARYFGADMEHGDAA